MPDRLPGSTDAPRTPTTGGPPAPPPEGPRVAAARAEVNFLMAEADAAGEKSRAAEIYFEAGHIQETELGSAKGALRAYTSALTVDPTFQPTAWALRRHLTARRQWENLIRALEAEARFASNTRSTDRSDLSLERAWLLREQLGKTDEARAGLVEATRLEPGNRAAWIALLLQALAKGPPEDVLRAFEGLIDRPSDVDDLAAWAGAHAFWCLMPAAHGEGASNLEDRAERAATALMGALDAGASDPFVLGLLDRLSCRHPALRMQVLERLVQPQGQDVRPPHALAARFTALREKARRLAAEGDLVGAGQALDQGLAVEPEHPVLAADRLDLAALEGRLELFDDWQARASEPEVVAELLFRRVDVALRHGAWGEAMGALERLSDAEPLADLRFVERARTLAALGDARALAEAFEAQARALIARFLGPSNESEGHEGRPLQQEAAHQYTRAAVLWEVELADSARAESLYARALEVWPSYRPAIEGLASVYTREGRWESLVELVAADASAAVTSERASALRESLVLLNRDLLGDLRAALAAQKALVQAFPGDVRALFRALDLAGRLADVEGSALDDALEIVRRLLTKVRSAPVRAALCLLAVRLVQGTGRDFEVDPWLDRAVAMDPASLAPAFIERRAGHDAARVRAALARELEAHADDPEVARALRFRQAFRALESGWPADALNALDPLVVRGDPAAVAWQVDIARRSREPQIIRRVLAGAASVRRGRPRAELAVWLGEVLESAGRRAEATTAYEEAQQLAEQEAHVDANLRAALGRLRVAAAETDIAGLVGAYTTLSAALPGPLGDALAVEARHVLLATGGAWQDEDAALDEGREAVRTLVAHVRGDDAGAFFDAIDGLAHAAPEGEARAQLHFMAALWSLPRSRERAVERLRWARSAAGGHAPSEVVLNELLLVEASEQADVLLARLARLEGASRADAGSADLGCLLALEAGALAETQGHLEAAAAAYVRALRWRESSLEALEGLRRLAQLAGARAEEARLLERIGDNLASANAAAAHHAEAALLLEADGDADGAIRLFRKVLARAPDDDEAFDRLAALLRDGGQWASLEKLLGFKLTRLRHGGPRCVPLWLERARLRHAPLGDVVGATADFRRVLMFNTHNFEAQWRLGQAASAEGAHQAARRRFEAALAAEPEVPAWSLSCLIDLAEVCVQIGDLESAREHLLTTQALLIHLEGDAGRAEADRLVTLALRLRCPEVAVRALETVAEGESAAARAVILARVGRVWRDNADGAAVRARAQAAFLRAVQCDPFNDAILDLAALGPPSFTSEETAQLRTALEPVLARTLSEGLFEPRLLETVSAYARCLGQSWRAAMADQILFLTGHGQARGQVRDVSGVLSASELFALGSAAGSPGVGAVQAIWPALQEQAGKAWASLEDLPSLGRGTRVKLGQDPRLGWVEATARALGFETLVVHQAGAESAVFVTSGPSPVLVLGPGLFGGDPGTRFRVARALALLRLGAPFLVNAKEGEAAAFVSAVLSAAGCGDALAQGFEPELAQRLSVMFGKKWGRALEVPLDARPVTLADVSAWVAHLARAAERFALGVASDVAAAVCTLVASRKLDDVRSSHAARDLLRFALREEHQRLRQDLGVSIEGAAHG